MLTYLERCFDEKQVEIIYLSVNLLFISANKAVAGNLCVQGDIFSTSSIQRRNLSVLGKEISSSQRTNLLKFDDHSLSDLMSSYCVFCDQGHECVEYLLHILQI